MMKKSLKPEYFEKVYAKNADPWNFTLSEYEADKYAVTLKSLPLEKYDSAFEIGCSIGVLTAQLAKRCKKLLAIDVSEKALEQAKKKCENLPNVRLEIMDVSKKFPDDKFDLILVSEVGYYLSKKDWQELMRKIFEHLTERGQVGLVHWTLFVEDYPQTGDEIHDSFAEFAKGKFEQIENIRKEKYRLDIWQKI
ncbi:MAG: class I SAM-dependent DNA methyltransferase [Pyrinomonadaceae bacterium]